MKKGDHLFLVDGSGYIFRAYHALPPLTRKSDGLPVGAVSGFCNMLWKLLSEARDTSVGVTPTHFAVIFDYSSHTFRNEMYADYKANRPPMPEDLRLQIEPLLKIVEAMGVPILREPGVEADDVIGTLARQGRAAGLDVVISTSDKDLTQLVEPGIIWLNTMSGERLDSAGVQAKFGVPPDRIVDYLTLIGDTVDNVPGVEKVGTKTAV